MDIIYNHGHENPKLHLGHDSTTEVAFCLKRKIKILLSTFLEPPYMQVGHTYNKSKLVLVPDISQIQQTELISYLFSNMVTMVTQLENK